jgi:putative GTP pyrophosphokinase
MASADDEKLLKEYESVKGTAQNFCNAIVEQIRTLLSKENISLAGPIEDRVKKWDSIRNKLERSKLELKSILQLNDLVGIRLILPFRRDLDKCLRLVEDNFVIIHKEDTSTRLKESQFGYQSYHFVIKLPGNWQYAPSLQGFDKYIAEIQIRTMAQHIWAVASHELQYKQEESVPQTLRRSIYRVSALLETVDLEFERTLSERDQYLKELKLELPDELLNVDLLRQILDKQLPIERRDVYEPYSELLQNLSKCEIRRSSQLIRLINEQLENVVQKDSEKAKKMYKNLPDEVKKPKSDMLKDKIDRLRRGIFLSHVDLVREMLSNKFGDRWKVINESDWVKVEVVNKKPKKQQGQGSQQ